MNEEELQAKTIAEGGFKIAFADQITGQDADVELSALEGGEVSWTFLGKAEKHEAVIKVKVTDAQELFHSEATALKCLEAHGCSVPEILHVGVHALVLEHIVATRVLWKTVAREVAALHSPLKGADVKYGAGEPRFFGLVKLEGHSEVTPQSWQQFWSKHRMEPALLAVQNWAAHTSRRDLLRIVERSRAAMGHANLPTEAPCLLHGDLWSGNILYAKNRKEKKVVFIDTSAWVGQRAVEVAQMELYGQFPATFWREYLRLLPISEDAQDSFPWYSLYFLLLQLWHIPRLAKSSFREEWVLQELELVLSHCEKLPRKTRSPARR